MALCVATEARCREAQILILGLSLGTWRCVELYNNLEMCTSIGIIDFALVMEHRTDTDMRSLTSF